jgi:hypothetical protein
VRASDALCRAADSRSRAPTPRSRTPCRVALLSGRLPRGTPRRSGFHRARLTVTAAGLERRTIGEPERLPSDRPGPCGSGGLGHACCSRASRRPAPCRLPRSRPAPSRAGGPLQAIPSVPAHPPVTRGLRQNSWRKMRLSDFCNRLHFTSTPRTARFPAAYLCATPCGVLRPRGAVRSNTRARPGPWTRR